MQKASYYQKLDEFEHAVLHLGYNAQMTGNDMMNVAFGIIQRINFMALDKHPEHQAEIVATLQKSFAEMLQHIKNRYHVAKALRTE